MTCGQQPPPGATFCPNCGGALNRAAAQPPPYAPPPYAPPPYAPPPYASPPQPAGPRQLSPSDSRNWAMGAHLAALVAAFFALAFVGPLVVWLLRRGDDAFAAEHGREALNFNLTALIVLVAGSIIGILTLGIGFIALAVYGVLWLVWTIQGAIAASNGRPYRYPLTIRFVS